MLTSLITQRTLNELATIRALLNGDADPKDGRARRVVVLEKVDELGRLLADVMVTAHGTEKELFQLVGGAELMERGANAEPQPAIADEPKPFGFAAGRKEAA